MTAKAVSPSDDGWLTSSFSSSGEACVQVRFADGVAYVRSTRKRGGPTVSFTRAEWEAFLLGAWGGEFDIPA